MRLRNRPKERERERRAREAKETARERARERGKEKGRTRGERTVSFIRSTVSHFTAFNLRESQMKRRGNSFLRRVARDSLTKLVLQIGFQFVKFS